MLQGICAELQGPDKDNEGRDCLSIMTLSFGGGRYFPGSFYMWYLTSLTPPPMSTVSRPVCVRPSGSKMIPLHCEMGGKKEAH